MRLFLLALLGATILSASTSAQDSPVPDPDSPGNAPLDPVQSLLRDAQLYADDFGVPVTEAVRRLELQQLVTGLNEKFQTREQGRFAGLRIEHTPQFRIVASFTSDPAGAVLRQTVGSPLAALVITEPAEFTLQTLLSNQENVVQAALDIGLRVEAGLNIEENRVELYTTDEPAVRSAVDGGRLTLPESVVVVEVDALSTLLIGESATVQATDAALIDSSPRAVTYMYGGLALSTCTSGYTVRNSSGTEGVMTAGHCGNTISYQGINLPYQDERFGGEYDLQWHTTPGLVIRSLVWDGQTHRTISSVASQYGHTNGRYVCKYGKMTGYTCGSITDPSYTGTTSEGVTLRGLVRISKSGTTLGIKGDSGGPTFTGTVAHGLVSVAIGTTGDIAYMPLHRISVLRLSAPAE